MYKTILSNTFAQLLAKFIGTSLALLTTYYTISLGGLDLYGDASKILALVAIGYTAIDFGLNASALRQGNTETEIRRALAQTLATRLLLSFFAVVLLNLFIFLLSGGYSLEIKRVFWIGSLSIIFQGIYTSGNAYFQYRLNYWYATLSVIVGALTTTLLTLYFLTVSPSLPTLILANTLGYGVMAILTLFFLPRGLRWDFHHYSQTLYRSRYLGFILLASILASKIDTIILGVFRPSFEVGAYAFAYRVFDVLLVLPSFVMNAIYPLLLRGRTHLLRRTLPILGLLGVLVGVISVLLSPLLTLLKPELSLSLPVLQILLLSLPIFYLTSPLMWDLIARAQDHLVLRIYTIAALGNMLLNLLLIPRFGIHAAAAVTVLTEFGILLPLLYYSLSPKNTRPKAKT